MAEHFNHPWQFQVNYVFSALALVVVGLSRFLAKHIGHLYTIQSNDSSHALLDGDSLASHLSQHVGRQSISVSYNKRSHQGCLYRPGAKGSAIIPFNLLASQRCVV